MTDRVSTDQNLERPSVATDPAGAIRAEDLHRLGTVLAVWAHPDDETYLAGGILAGLSDLGHRVVCVTATRGEAADPDATAGERAALADLRTRELEEALGVLGVDEHRWLDLPDGGCATVDPDAPVGCLTELVHDLRPDTVLTFGPDGFTGHPDHRAVSAWVDSALARTADRIRRPALLHAVLAADSRERQPPGLDERSVYYLGRPRVCADEELGLRLDLAAGPRTAALLDRKVEALRRQESQTRGVIDAVGAAAFRSWVSVETYAPPR